MVPTSLMLLAVALALSAAASVRAEPGTGDDASPDLVELPTTIVTARRREEELAQVPVAATALAAPTLDSYGVDNLGELDALVPNLTIYATRGYSSAATAYIRGVGQSDPLWGVEPGVGIYVDDVYIARAQGALLNLLDVERIEVLRGPQGTLYGKNTIGGAIRYLTRQPVAATEGRADVAIGSYARFDVRAVANTPLGGDGASARIAVASLNHDGFGENRVNGAPVSDQEVLVARAAVALHPRDGLDVTFSGDWLDDQSGVRGGQRLNAFNPFDPQRTPPFDDRYDIASGMPNVSDVASAGASATVAWGHGDGWSLKSITAWRSTDTELNIDFDQLPNQIVDVSGTLEDEQLSQELQLAISHDSLAGVVGAYWFDGSAGGTVRNNFRGASFTGTSGEQDTESLALYGEGTWRFATAWSLTLGARWTDETKRADIRNFVFANATSTTPIGTQADFDDEASFSDVSPRVALDWQATDTLMLYASASRGFKSGGFNVRANVAAVPESARPFDDESVTAYELGAKYAALDGRLSFAAAAFHEDYRDIQLSVFSAYDSDGDGVDDAFFGDFTNAARGTIEGLELELSARLGENWLLQGQYAWLDARYDEYVDRGVDVADTKYFTNAPPRSGMMSLVRTWSLAHGELAARATYARQSKVYPTTDLTEAIAQGSYGLFDASLTWRSAARPWTVVLQGSNLADTEYRTSGYSVPVFGILTGFYGEPRQLSLGIRREW